MGPEGLRRVITTRGDANSSPIPGLDFPIFKENYVGKVVYIFHLFN
jgi:signal peptidase